MLKVTAGIVLLGFAISIGAHLPLLQAAASVNMMREHCARDFWLDALKETIEETISGSHQCAICRMVRNSLFSPSVNLSRSGLKQPPRFDSYRAAPAPLSSPRASIFKARALKRAATRLGAPPPVPPPRAV